jgi:hypothetical protein
MSMRAILKRVYQNLPLLRELTQVREEIKCVRDTLIQAEVKHAVEKVDREIRENPRYADARKLNRFEFQVYSQSGEDGIVREIFRRIPPADRTFVEIGVGDGLENNTAFLLSMGWKGFWVDANEYFEKTVRDHPELGGGVLQTARCFVTREEIAGIFEKIGVPREFDFLSIDIDMNTYYIWEALAGYRPRVVVVEYNAALPADVDWKVHYRADRVADLSHNFGASLKAYENLGRRLGYALVGCDFTGTNAFFVRNDLADEKIFAAPFTSENHYEPPKYYLHHRRGHGATLLDRMPS